MLTKKMIETPFWEASEELRDNKELALYVVSSQGYLIQEASARLRDDEEVALEALSQQPGAIQFVSERLRDDKDFILKAFEIIHGGGKRFAHLANFGYEYLSERLRDDEEILSRLIGCRPRFLGLASERLKNDKEFLLKHLYNDLPCYASDALKDDPEFLMNFTHPVEFASERLKDDRDFVLKAILKGYGDLRFASDRLREDIGLCFASSRSGSYHSMCCSPRLRHFMAELHKPNRFEFPPYVGLSTPRTRK